MVARYNKRLGCGGGVGVGAGTVPPGLVKQAINAGPGQAAAENARRAYTPLP